MMKREMENIKDIQMNFQFKLITPGMKNKHWKDDQQIMTQE